jgi:Lipocalin-like domain
MSISIVGTWRLVRAETVDGDGRYLPPPYGGEKAMGHLVFNADGRMMAVLCDGRSTLPDSLSREYNSYCGNYSFDGAQLTTRVDASAAGIALDSVQVRDVTTEGDLMVLRPPPRRAGKSVEQRILYWEKISAR